LNPNRALHWKPGAPSCIKGVRSHRTHLSLPLSRIPGAQFKPLCMLRCTECVTRCSFASGSVDHSAFLCITITDTPFRPRVSGTAWNRHYSRVFCSRFGLAVAHHTGPCRIPLDRAQGVARGAGPVSSAVSSAPL
jgi:hypothetical protein